MDEEPGDGRGLSEAVTRARAGEVAAWDEIARRHTHRVIVSLLARGVPLQSAEDLTQETWMRLVQRQRDGRLRSLSLPGLAIAQAAWLAREVDRTRARRQGIAGMRPLEAAREVEDSDPSVDPERQTISRERLESVMREIERCSPRARRVFLAVYGPEPRGHGEVARDLGLSIQGVRQILHEVRTRARRATERFEGE